MVQLFAGLRGAARRSLFRLYAQGRFRPGIAAETIISETKALGISIRRTDALSIVREVAGREISRATMRYVPDKAVPGMHHYTPTRLRLQKKFQTILEVRGKNVLTGLPDSRQVSFMSDERVSMEGMKRDLLERAQTEYAPREGIDYTDIVAVEGLMRAEPPFAEED